MIVNGRYTKILAGKSPYIRSYTVCIYRSGQPYVYVLVIFKVSPDSFELGLAVMLRYA